MSEQIYKFTVGDFNCISIQDEDGVQPATQFFPNVPEDELKQLLDADGYGDELVLSFNCVLIETGDKRVLIDTGNGVETDGDGRLLSHLETLGIQVESIDVVVLTHAHGDHYAAMMLANGDKIFPNAQYMMWRDEWGYYSSEERLEIEGQRENGEERLAFIKKYFVSLKDHLTFLDADNTEIIDGINAVYAPGHTRHHIAVQVESGGEVLLIAGDALIHPLHFNNPDWHWAFEYDSEQLKQSRKMLTEIAIDKNVLFHAFHFAFPGLGRVSKDGERVTWTPVNV